MPAANRIDEETRRRIAAWIRVEMAERGAASVREFARLIGVSHAYLSRVVAGRQTPGLELVLRLVRTLDLSADRLLFEEPPGTVPVAAEPVAAVRGPAGGPPPTARRIDPERWLARAREARALVRKPLTDAAARKLKRVGRP
jgi:transcriptional regulator with XRE-family HTH domain